MVLISVKWLFMHFDSCHAYIFYIELFQKRIKIQINIWRNTFYKERVHVYMCGFLTSSILIDEVNNYTRVILRIACFDLNCPLFTCLDFWHRLSSIQKGRLNQVAVHNLDIHTCFQLKFWSWYNAIMKTTFTSWKLRKALDLESNHCTAGS